MRTCASYHGPRPEEKVMLVAAPLLALVLLLGQVAPASAFALGPTSPGKWGPEALGTGATVTWSLMPDGTPAPGDHIGGSSLFASILDVLGPTATTAISNAFDTWVSVTNLTILQVGDTGLPFDNVNATGANAGDIRFGGYAFDGVFGVLAHAYLPPENGVTAAGDAHFDIAEPWVLSVLPEGSPTPGQIDWETVLLHELGHSLGLDHSTAPGAVMTAFYSGVHRVLSPDDIAGIQTLYGVPETVIPEPANTNWLWSRWRSAAASDCSPAPTITVRDIRCTTTTVPTRTSGMSSPEWLKPD